MALPAPKLPPAPRIPTTDLLSFLFSAAQSQVDPNRPLFVSAENQKVSYTHAESLALIRRLIRGFRLLPALQKTPGQSAPVVLIHSYNSALYPILILSIIGAGAIFVGSNPAYTPYELSHAIRATGADIVLCEPEPEMLSRMRTAMRENGVSEANLWTLDANPGQSSHLGSEIRSWRILLTHGSSDWVRFNDKSTSEETTACFFFSSGTTGLPKPVRISHYNLIAQHVLVYQPYQHLRQPSVPGYEHGVKTVMAIPVFHIGIGPLTFVTSVKEGRTAYIMRRFDLELFLKINEREKCNEILIVPPIGNAIVNSGLADDKDARFKYSLRTLKYGLFGAAPLGRDLQNKVQALLAPDAVLGQLWGMTETCCIASFVPPGTEIGKHGHDVAGSVGWTTPGLEIKVVNDAGEEARDGEQGEMWARGPTVTQGYFGQQSRKANEEAFTADGWIRSGDLGCRDRVTGLFYIVGRLKELIKVRGFQVSPSEIEDVLRVLPGVGDVAIAGVETGDGEAPRAFVVRTGDEKGRTLTEEDVKKGVRERLASYKALEGGVRFLDVIPRNASGKILRRVLVEMEKEKRNGKAASKL